MTRTRKDQWVNHSDLQLILNDTIKRDRSGMDRKLDRHDKSNTVKCYIT